MVKNMSDSERQLMDLYRGVVPVLCDVYEVVGEYIGKQLDDSLNNMIKECSLIRNRYTDKCLVINEIQSLITNVYDMFDAYEDRSCDEMKSMLDDIFALETIIINEG